MGCASSKAAAEEERVNGAHRMSKPSFPPGKSSLASSDSTVPALVAAVPTPPAGASGEPPASPTSSITTSASHISQLSTWDMRELQGPLVQTRLSVEGASLTPVGTPIQSSTLAADPTHPSPVPFRPIHSPSLLGTPALQEAIKDLGPAPTRHLLVTKLGGCTLVNQYLVVQYLGKGTSGRVFLCMDVLDRRLYAVKIVKRPQMPPPTPLPAPKEGGGGEEATPPPTATPPPPQLPAGTPSPPHADVSGGGTKKEPQTPANAAIPDPKNVPPSHPVSAGSIGGKRRLRRHQRDLLADLRREIEIMRGGGSHPNIVALREVVDDPTSNKMLIVMGYCEGGPVMTRPGLERGRRIPEDVARAYFRDMVAALAFLHSRRVVHGDLKPENALMCATGRVVLSDFGCSKILKEGSDTVDRCNGTPAFLAPEMMAPGSFRGRPADVYALGACLFTFIYGKIPFIADTIPELFKVVQNEALVFPPSPAACQQLRDLLGGMLCKDPEARLTLVDVAQHAWTTDAGRLPPARCSRSGDEPGTKAIEADGEAALLSMLREDLEVRSYAPGQWVMRQGERCGRLLYVLSGEVEVLYRPAEEVYRPTPKAETNRRASIASNASNASSGKAFRGCSGGGGGTPASLPTGHKLWSPTARLRRSGHGTPLVQPSRLGASSQSQQKAAASDATPTAISFQRQLSTDPGFYSPRLGNGAGPTPEPSPRFARDTNSSFQLALGPPAAESQPPFSTAIDSAVTTPAATPLPSARDTQQPSSARGPLQQQLLPGTPPQPPAAAAEPPQSSTEATPAAAPLLANEMTAAVAAAAAALGGSGGTPGGAAIESHANSDVASPFTPFGAVGLSSSGGNSSLRLMPRAGDSTPDGTSISIPMRTSLSGASGGGGGKLSAYPLMLTSTFDSDMGSEGREDKELSMLTQCGTMDMAALKELQLENRNAAGEEVSLRSQYSLEAAEQAEIDQVAAAEAAAREAGSNGSQNGGSVVAATDLETPRSDGEGGKSAVAADLERSATTPAPSTAAAEQHDPASTAGGGAPSSPPTAPSSPISSPSLSPARQTPPNRRPLLPARVFNTSPSKLRSPLPPPSVRRIPEEAPLPDTPLADTNAKGTVDKEQEEEEEERKRHGEELVGELAAAADEADEFVGTLGRGGDYMLARRGPGEFLSTTPLIGGGDRRQSCSVRAAGSGVRVAVIPYSVAKEHFRAYPLAKQRLAELVWSRQSETIVLEALMRLAGLANDLKTMSNTMHDSDDDSA